MSRLWPLAPYAEDQNHSTAILTTHVLTRGFQTGALFGSGIGAALAFRNRKAVRATLGPSANIYLAPVLRATGIGAVAGTALISAALVQRMWGREEIEWQDRSWRLLHNRGQVECDDWTYGGMAVGAVGGVVRRAGILGVVGGMGAGSLVGMMGYMGWRYGIKGGKFEEKL